MCTPRQSHASHGRRLPALRSLLLPPLTSLLLRESLCSGFYGQKSRSPSFSLYKWNRIAYTVKKKCGYSILTLRLSNSSTLCNISFFFVIAVQHPTMCLSVLWSVEFLFWRLLLTFSHVAFVAFVGGEWPIRGHVQRQRTLANAFPECFYQPAPPAAERGMQAPPPPAPHQSLVLWSVLL